MFLHRRPDVYSEPSGDIIIALLLCSFSQTVGMFSLLVYAEDVAMWRFPSNFFLNLLEVMICVCVCTLACGSVCVHICKRESRALWHLNLRLALLLINLVFTNKLMSDGPSSQHDVSSNFFLCIIFLRRVSRALLWPFFFSHPPPLSLSLAMSSFNTRNYGLNYLPGSSDQHEGAKWDTIVHNLVHSDLNEAVIRSDLHNITMWAHIRVH